MSSVIRDFSQEAVANIRELIRENVDEEKQFFLWDWIDDSFKMDDLNIQDYLNDVSKYQSHMVDKHNINSKKFDKILERVKSVDVNYAKRFNEIYESVVSYNNKILKVTNMISPEGMTLKSDVYDSVIDGIERIHNKDIDYLKYDLEYYDDELPVLRDIPWYEKALNAVGGTAVSLIRDNVEGLCFIPYAIVDGMFGTNLNERLQSCLDDAEEYLINNVVTDEQFYYYGKTVGNVICMVEGAIFIANGLTTIAGGITLLGGGTALSSTGVSAIFGGPAIAVSIPAVAVGTIAISSGGGIIYSSMNNFEENLSKAQEAKTSKVDEVKTKDDIKELDMKLKEATRSTGRMNMAGKTHPVTGVKFDNDGFPIFESKYNIKLDPADYSKSRGTHFDRASKALYEQIKRDSELASKFTAKEIEIFKEVGVPKRFTWHHNQEPGLMQLVDRNIHRKTGHDGGFSIWGPGN